MALRNRGRACPPRHLQGCYLALASPWTRVGTLLSCLTLSVTAKSWKPSDGLRTMFPAYLSACADSCPNAPRSRIPGSVGASPDRRGHGRKQAAGHGWWRSPAELGTRETILWFQGVDQNGQTRTQ